MVDASTALKNSDIYALISLIASDVASCDFIIPDPFNRVFNNPNNLTNGFAFKQSIVAQLCLAGNAYVYMTKNKAGIPIKLEQIPPDDVEILMEDDGSDLQYKITFDDDRPSVTIPSTEMLHFKLLSVGNNNNQYIGISPLQSLTNEVNLQDYSSKLSLSAIKNAIAPSYTLTIPQAIVDTDAKNNIRTEFDKANTGDNAGKAIVLDQGIQLAPIKIDADIVKNLNDIDWTRNQISKAFGVPSDMLNSESEHSNIDQMRSLYATSLNRYINPLTSEMQMKWGVTVKSDITPAIDPDNSQYIKMVETLSTGKVPVLNPQQAISALRSKGVFTDEV